MLLGKKLKTKSIRALTERRIRNKRWRTDLVKRYWINNSDGEDEEDVDYNVGDGKMQITLGNGEAVLKEFEARCPEAYDKDFRGNLKDEFFPVQICVHKRHIQPNDPTSVMVYDVVEPLPTFCVLEGRMQTEVQYLGEKPPNDNTTASEKLMGDRTFGSSLVKPRMFA